MLEKPDIPDSLIQSRIELAYRLGPVQVTFLPLGVDINSAAYRVDAGDGAAYFLKVRQGAFDELSVELPHFLKDAGVEAIIAPLASVSGRLWGELSEDYHMVLYPFVHGEDGYQVGLSDSNWHDLGANLKKVHTARLPRRLRERLPVEDYTPHWREVVRRLQAQVERGVFGDPLPAELASFMREKQSLIERIVGRAIQLALELSVREPAFTLCHGDLHPGNLFLSDEDSLYIVDWDDAILAPKEHDLMLLGAGMGIDEPRQVELFYQGYGLVQVDRPALAYYRYERIVRDLAAFGEQVFSTRGKGGDRAQAVEYFKGQFEAGNVVEAAINGDEG
jgi:spectinomycin phosphotransferase